MASKAPKPTISERAVQNICPNCGKPRPMRAHGARGIGGDFCPPPEGEKRSRCQVEHQNRRVSEGAAVIALAKAWRVDRGQGEIAQKAFQQFIQILDGFNAADAAYRGPDGETRPRADLFAAKMMNRWNGDSYLDRKLGRGA